MRILITIPHFYQARRDGGHGSSRQSPEQRIAALSQSLWQWYRLFDPSQSMIHIEQRGTFSVNESLALELTIVICTVPQHHVLDHLTVPAGFYQHQEHEVDPRHLGFVCRQILGEQEGNYDWYGYMEDDLRIHDPWFFQKLKWFQSWAGIECVWQPHRFEWGEHPPYKIYVDGPLARRVTEPFQSLDQHSFLHAEWGGLMLTFKRPRNPHAGCYFVSQDQLAFWKTHASFDPIDTSFVGPLESAATLSLMQTFRVYKTIPRQANLLEIEHGDVMFHPLIGQQVAWHQGT